ncbi:MAG TPA: serine hydrolase domain-containing protein [Candidatus Cybelea sp.]
MREHRLKGLRRSSFIAGVASVAAIPRLGAAAGKPSAAALQKYLRIFSSRADFYGVVWLRNQSREIAQSVGYADKAQKTVNQPGTTFLIGSISKHFTAVAIMLLQRSGKLRVEDPITEYLPELTYAKGATIAQMLSHRGGFTRDFIGTSKMLDTGAILSASTRLQLISAPGSAYSYSNVAYALLAVVIERLSGRSFDNFMRDNIFMPAGMTNSGALTNIRPAGLAIGYVPGLGTSLEALPESWRDNVTGAGSLYSTSLDMLRWDNALWNGTILTKNEISELTKDRGDGYGFGLIVGTRDNHRVVGHDGQTTGFVARYDHFPDENAALLVLGNVDTGAPAYLRRGLTKILFAETPDAVVLPALVARDLDAVAGAHYAGTYAVSPQFDFQVVYQRSALFIPGNGGYLAALSPAVDGSFFYRELYATLRFAENVGPASELVWTDPSGTYHCPRKTAP